jgi:hypothetical protein
MQAVASNAADFDHPERDTSRHLQGSILSGKGMSSAAAGPVAYLAMTSSAGQLHRTDNVAKDREGLLVDDILATRSTPMVARKGEMVGVLSIRGRKQHRPAIRSDDGVSQTLFFRKG